MSLVCPFCEEGASKCECDSTREIVVDGLRIEDLEKCKNVMIEQGPMTKEFRMSNPIDFFTYNDIPVKEAHSITVLGIPVIEDPSIPDGEWRAFDENDREIARGSYKDANENV